MIKLDMNLNVALKLVDYRKEFSTFKKGYYRPSTITSCYEQKYVLATMTPSTRKPLKLCIHDFKLDF